MPLAIGTDALRFILNNESNFGCLDGVHIAGGSNILVGPTPLWQLTATRCNASFPAAGGILQSCTAACDRKYAVHGATTELNWENCTTPFAGRLSVRVTVSFEGGVSTWGASATPMGAPICVQSLTLPDLRTLRMRPGTEQLFVPYYFGAAGTCDDGGYANIFGGFEPDVCRETSPDCDAKADGEINAMPSGSGRTMSYTSWISAPEGTPGAVGLYVGAHDALSRLKYLPAGCLRDDGASAFTHAGLRAVHLAHDFSAPVTFVLSYPVVVAAFHGGWWDAAQIYRGWALTNAVWARKGNLSQRADVPAWLLRAPLWLRLSGDDPADAGTDAKVDGVRELFGLNGSAITDIGFHWYSWNTEVFDSKYPVYTARRGFGDACARLQQPHAGVTARVVPYTNGRLWDPTDGLKLAAATCNGRNQTPYHEVYHSGVTFSVMDPSAPLMQQVWSEEVGRIANDYNTSGVYIDQVSCSRAEVCYSAANATNHSSWAAGSQALLAKSAAAAGPQRAIISEAHDQTALADLHGFLSIYGFVGNLACRTALAWQAVYGGWSVNVGDMRWPPTPATRDPSSAKLRFNQTEAAAWRAIAAQGFVSGGVLGWFTASADRLNWIGLGDDDVAFLRLLASTKVRAARYLTYGSLWRPPAWVGRPPPTIALHDYSYYEHNASQSCPTPVVLAECWRADDGSVALVAANHADGDHALNVSVNLAPSGGAVPHLVRVEAAMAPRSVVVHVLSAHDAMTVTNAPTGR